VLERRWLRCSRVFRSLSAPEADGYAREDFYLSPIILWVPGDEEGDEPMSENERT
jgi:hypothetical protein